MQRRTLFWLIAGLAGAAVAIVFGLRRAAFDPDFCEKRCPICTRARRGNRFARFLQNIEMAVTFGGCPWGRARQEKYGVRPNELLPIRRNHDAVAG